MGWSDARSIEPRSYVCGHCGNQVGSAVGYDDPYQDRAYIYICPTCEKPTYFGQGRQTPGIRPGVEVEFLPEGVGALYREARDCVAVSAYTASVLVCRKLLMHIAVEKEAKVGGKFIEYVEYLSEKGYVPPNGKRWVDHIRQKGNEANHEISVMSAEDARELLMFVEMLLKFVYEFPSRIPGEPGASGSV